MKYFLILIPFYVWMLFFIDGDDDKKQWNIQTPLAEVLTELGNETHLKKPKNYSVEKAAIGEDLIKNGFTKKRKGSKTISLFYDCTSCHNLVQEDPELFNPNPEARLSYTSNRDIPFLQATTFFGIVNRESWYNDDYVKKYGSLVEKARNNIEEAIQLCAQECAQGRKLKSWEVEAIMAYYWQLQLKLGDIGLTEEELAKLNNADTPEEKQDMIKAIRSKYLLASPATFSDAPKDKKKGYAVESPNLENGKLVYENSCLYCHDANGVTEYELDKNTLSFKKFIIDMLKNTSLSFYQEIRYGTYPVPGHRPYMPHYPLERMSDQQVEDLRAYIEDKSK